VTTTGISAGPHGLQNRPALPIALLRCRHGLFFVLTSDVNVGRSLEFYGEFSEVEAALLVSLVRPGAVVLDIGANMGAFTIPLAHAVGPTGHVLAFEPQTIFHRIIRANAAVNNLAGVVSVRQAAIGESRGRIDVPIFDYALDSNFGGWDISLRQFSGQPIRPLPSETVDLITVDGLALGACDLIKIDVEGMELDVIAGAKETIGRHRPVIYLEAREKAPALFASLDALGYRAWWHHPPMFNPANFRGVAENLWPGLPSLNVLCLPSEKAAIAEHLGLVPILDPFAAPGESRPGRVAG
jgi:FkbM family methyltransferase